MTQVALVLDATAHPADAIQRAAYKFADRFSIELSRDDERFRCLLFPSNGELDDAVVAAFRNEVIDQVLRTRIREETEAVRNLVLALAFSKVELAEEV